MPREKSMSALLSQTAPTGSINLTELPKVDLSTVRRSVLQGGVGAVAVEATIAIDLSGSYMESSPAFKSGATKLLERIKGDPEIRNRVMLKRAGMSCEFIETGFALAEKLEPLNVIPGGNSPYGLMIDRLTELCGVGGQAAITKIHIITGDGQNNPGAEVPDELRDLAEPIAKYRSKQQETNTHVFPVAIDDGSTPANTEVMASLSTNHELFHIKSDRVDEVFANIFTLIKNTVLDSKSIARTKSLNLNELRERAAEMAARLEGEAKAE